MVTLPNGCQGLRPKTFPLHSHPDNVGSEKALCCGRLVLSESAAHAVGLKESAACLYSGQICLLWRGWYFLTSWTRLQNGRHGNQRANHEPGVEFDFIEKKDKTLEMFESEIILLHQFVKRCVNTFLTTSFQMREIIAVYSKMKPKRLHRPLDYSFETFKKTCYI